MELRSALNGKPVLTTILCLLLVGIGATYFVGGGIHGSKATHYPILGNYYTPDDGQTWITDNWAQITPFDRDGKTYVKVFLFSCDGKTPFVGYLEKYTQETHDELTAIQEPRQQWLRMSDLGDHGLVVKKIGSTDWIPKDSLEGRAIIQVMCPNTTDPAQPMLPDISTK